MSWECPGCKRSFKNKNQQHSCVKVNAEDLFAGKSPVVHNIYEILTGKVKSFGDIKIHPSKSTINFSAEGTFLVFKPKKEWMEIEFISEKEIISAPVTKSIKYGKGYALTLRIEHPDNINKKILDWIKKAYEISSHKSKSKEI